MQIPLVIATISTWFTLALLLLSLPQVYLFQEHEQVRHILLLSIGFHLIAYRLDAHETDSRVPSRISGPVWPCICRHFSGSSLDLEGM